eukprot:148945_1
MSTQIDRMYEDYFAEQSSSSLFRYNHPDSEEQTVFYLNTTHSRRTTNIYSQTPPATSVAKRQSRIGGRKSNSLPPHTGGEYKDSEDIDMNVFCNDDDDEDIDMVVRDRDPHNKKIETKPNHKSVLGQRSFATAFEQNEQGGVITNHYNGYHKNTYGSDTNQYKIQVPFCKKQRT